MDMFPENMTGLDSDAVALEKMVYGTFRRTYTAYMKAQIPRKLTLISEAQLPSNSVLHLTDGLMDMNNESILPDITNPLITNEDFVVYMNHVFKIPEKDVPIFGVDDKYRFVPARFTPQIQKFNQTNRIVRRMPSVESVLPRPNVLSVFNYNPLLKVYMHGRMIPLRKFQLLIKSMLAHIVELEEKYPGKHHFIQMPLSVDTYSKIQYERAFKVFNMTTIRIWDDMSYFFMIHLLGYLAGGETSLFKELSPELLERLNVVLSCGTEEGIIYNLGDLKVMAGTNRVFYLNVMRHVNLLKLKVASLLEEENLENVTEDQLDQLTDVNARADKDESTSSKEETVSDPSEPEEVVRPEDKISAPIKSSSKEIKKPVTMDVKKEQQRHQDYVAETVEEILTAPPVPLTEVQKTYARDSVKRYRDIDLGGRPLSELVTEGDDPNIHEQDIVALKDKLSDPSMSRSSVNSFDRIYVEKQLDRDVASVLTSFASVGMFIQEVSETKEVTEFNRIRHVRTVFTDLQGKRHTVSFKLPLVDSEGTMVINGIKSRMIKQQVNLPICKVSPTRVSLSSNFNKTLVERNLSAAHDFGKHIARYVSALRRAGLVKLEFGKTETSDKLPYDYTCLMERYTSLTFKDYLFTFDYPNRFEGLTPATEAIDQSMLREKALVPYEKALSSVYCGKKGDLWLFYGADNIIRAIKPGQSEKNIDVEEAYTLRELFDELFNQGVPTPKLPAEWTELKIQDRSFPIIFILGYKFGLTKILNELGHPYRFIPEGTRAPIGVDEIAIAFADGKLVFPRYPLETSLILGGLDWFKTRDYVFAHFDLPDTYFTLLSEKRLSTNYLKGIDAFFKLFVDPITRDILIRMGEPTTVKGLLYRATQMLSTQEAKPSSSMANFRTRGYERFPDLLYNEIARNLAKYQTLRPAKKGFSLNPEAVLMSIMADPTIQQVEDINPIHDLKLKSQITYAGAGGRTSQSFVVRDRTYPKDAVGIISEATPDSGKVGLNAYTSADPLLSNIRGMYDMSKVASGSLEPANVLSAAALLMPGATQDDRSCCPPI